VWLAKPIEGEPSPDRLWLAARRHDEGDLFAPRAGGPDRCRYELCAGCVDLGRIRQIDPAGIPAQKRDQAPLLLLDISDDVGQNRHLDLELSYPC